MSTPPPPSVFSACVQNNRFFLMSHFLVSNAFVKLHFWVFFMYYIFSIFLYIVLDIFNNMILFHSPNHWGSLMQRMDEWANILIQLFINMRQNIPLLNKVFRRQISNIFNILYFLFGIYKTAMSANFFNLCIDKKISRFKKRKSAPPQKKKN